MKIFEAADFARRVELILLIGTRNRLPLIKKCLESVASFLENDWRVVVIDAGSTDGTIEYLKGFDNPRFSLVEDGKKMGQARSLNNVLGQISCEFVGWISDDNTFVFGGPRDAVAALRKKPWLGMVGMKVKDTSGAHANAPYVGGLWPTGILNINQGIIRHDLFRKLGFFDEVYGSYGIDSDLTTKVLLEGYAVALTKDVSILHDRNHADMPGAFTSSERTAEIERARDIYRDRYERALKFKPHSAYKRVAGYIWWRVMKSRTLEPYREEFIRRVLLSRRMSMRDIHNVVFGRWISIFDLLIHKGKKTYLYQSIPFWWRLIYRMRTRSKYSPAEAGSLQAAQRQP